MNELEKLQSKLKRTTKALKEAEGLLETKSKELYLLNQSLEQQVTERVQELEEAKNKAVKATKAKDRFLANMSHEFRTPLNGILGMLTLLKETELSAEQLDYVKIINKSGNLLLSLITDVLDHAKIEAGEVNIELIDFDIERTVESVMDIMHYSAFESDVTLNSHISEDCPKVFKSDERKVSQILINLIGNAIKFTPKGEVNIALNSSSNGVEISVSDTGIGIPKQKIDNVFTPFKQVDESDTRKYGGSGLGLSICKVFAESLGGEISVISNEGKGTTFTFTLKNFTSSQSKETVDLSNQNINLALCLSNSYLEEMISEKCKAWGVSCLIFNSLQDLEKSFKEKKSQNFKVIVEDQLITKSWNLKPSHEIYVLSHLMNIKKLNDQNPSFFFIKHPLHRSNLIKILNSKIVSERKNIPSKKNEVQETLPTNTNILLVEDNLINQKVAEQFLKNAGYQVTIAQNGREALSLCYKQFFKIILMDYHMPIMNGVEATKAIRSFQSTSKQRSYIMAMTASAMREAKEACFEAGMDDFITKPINNKELSSRIEKALLKKS